MPTKRPGDELTLSLATRFRPIRRVPAGQKTGPVAFALPVEAGTEVVALAFAACLYYGIRPSPGERATVRRLASGDQSTED